MYGKGTDPFGEAVQRRIDELGDGFVGRGWLVERLLEDVAIMDGGGGGRKNMSLLAGESGTGKTTLMCHLLNASFCDKQGGPWKVLHDRILARHMCTVNDSDSLDPVLWAKSLSGKAGCLLLW